jgi:hypothetical protein
MHLTNLGLSKTKIKAKPGKLGIKRNYYITLSITNSDVEIGFHNLTLSLPDFKNPVEYM